MSFQFPLQILQFPLQARHFSFQFSDPRLVSRIIVGSYCRIPLQLSFRRPEVCIGQVFAMFRLFLCLHPRCKLTDIARCGGQSLAIVQRTANITPAFNGPVVDFQPSIHGCFQAGVRPDPLCHHARIRCVVTLQFTLDLVLMQKLVLQGSDAEIQSAHALQIGGADKSAKLTVIHDDNGASGCHCLDCSARLCKDNVIVRQDGLRVHGRPTGVLSNDIDAFDTHAGAGVSYRLRDLSRRIAEDKCGLRLVRKVPHLSEAVEIDKIMQDRDLVSRYARTGQKTFPAQVINRDIVQDVREDRWPFLPGNPAVTGIGDRHLRKTKRGRHRFQMMLPVDHIGHRGQVPQVVNDRNGRRSETVGNRAKALAVGDREVPAPHEGQRQIPEIKLRPGWLIQRVVGHQDPERTTVSLHEASSQALREPGRQRQTACQGAYRARLPG